MVKKHGYLQRWKDVAGDMLSSSENRTSRIWNYLSQTRASVVNRTEVDKWSKRLGSCRSTQVM